MDRLRSMEVFVAVVDAGSFTGAAAAFEISPVMVGKHIRALEERMGARLLMRTTRRQKLTEIGLAYAERCRHILAEIRAAESGAEAMRSTPRGTLRISAPTAFGTMCIAPAVTHYLSLYPEVRVELNFADRMIDLVEEGYDAAIRIGKLRNSNLIARPLTTYRMMICASPNYLERAGIPKTPQDLASHECLDFTAEERRVRWKLNGKEIDLPASRFCSNNGLALRMAALQGFGIVQQSEAMLGDDVKAGRLVSLLKEFLPPPRPVSLVYSRDQYATPKMKTFIDFMLLRFAAEGPLKNPAGARKTETDKVRRKARPA